MVASGFVAMAKVRLGRGELGGEASDEEGDGRTKPDHSDSGREGSSEGDKGGSGTSEAETRRGERSTEEELAVADGVGECRTDNSARQSITLSSSLDTSSDRASLLRCSDELTKDEGLTANLLGCGRVRSSPNGPVSRLRESEEEIRIGSEEKEDKRGERE